jgi:YbbR domain-containing protein
MMRWLINNLGLILLSLILGGITWSVSSFQEDPIEDFTLPAKVVKVNENTLRNAVVVSDLPSAVMMEVRTTNSQIKNPNAQPGQVEIDFAALGYGEHIVNLKPTLNLKPASLSSYSPVTATIKIEPLIQTKVPIILSVIGSTATGFQVGQKNIQPREVIITGTKQLTEKVASVVAEISVSGARTSVESSNVRISVRDINGEIVSGIKVMPETISAKVSIEQLGNYRDLPVVPRWRGQPADGYSIQDISVDPIVVTVFGPENIVQATKGYVETQEVVINNAQNDIDERVGLNIPQGVSLVTESNLQTVRVRMRIQPVLSSKTLKRSPVLTGLRNGLVGKISPATIDIVLSGPLSRLNNLTENDIKVTLDVNGLDVGTHQIEPKIIRPEGLLAQSVFPATVQVEITKK